MMPEAGQNMRPSGPNPLATQAQIACEKETLRLERHPLIQPIREDLRQVMLDDSGAQTEDGRAALDRALDQWIRCHILMQLTRELAVPSMIWIADNTPRTWFGHTFPGDIIAGDNPDNSNRMTYLSGDSVYELTGRFGAPKSGQFNLNIEVAHPAGGMGEHLATLTDKDLRLEADGGFRVMIGGAPDGGVNHMQTRPGLMNFVARDSRSDWTQDATTLGLRLVSGPGLVPSPNEDEKVKRIAGGLFAFVDYWRQFKDRFFGFPEPNRLVMPKRRDSEGGWGHLGGGRFKLRDDEALIITTTDGGADYTGFQVTDPWTLRPESTLRASSLNKGQSQRNPDGSCTYAMALQDPGIANWIDTAGLHEGWFLMRWQNLPRGSNPTATELQLVKLDEIDRHVGPNVPRADLDYRRRQIRDRVEQVAHRIREEGA